MKTIIISILLLTSILPASAQMECSYYHRKNCENKEGTPMKYDSQSKSAILGKGQISEFHMVAYHGLDYRITLCSEENLGGQIQFKIYEKSRELIKPEEVLVDETVYEEETIDLEAEDEYADETYEDYYEDSYDDSYSDAYEDEEDVNVSNKPKFKIVKELLYDNSSDSYNNILEFTADGSMSLIIEVIVPGEGSGASKLKIREMGCVGVLIEHAKSRKAGF